MKSPYLAESQGKAEFNNALGDAAILYCPKCGDINLHQVASEACWRDDEDGPGTVTYSAPGLIHSYRADDGDLPGRRDCVHLLFYCEACHGEPKNGHFTLRIEQHKGETRMYWVAS